MNETREIIKVEGAKIIYKNFAGRESQYNPIKPGKITADRNFCLVLENELAEYLITSGWNVKSRPARIEGDPDEFYLQITARWDPKPPVVYINNGNGKYIPLTEDMVGILDGTDIEYIDMEFVPYRYTVAGRSGIKAFLKKMYVDPYISELDRKYSGQITNSYNDTGYEGEV